MKYLVVGAGGVGACIAGYMAHAGKDVALIARGAHLEAMRKSGLLLHTAQHGVLRVPVRAFAEEDYRESPDVVFVCVKAYSIDSILPLLNRVCNKRTVVLPILNAMGVGAVLAAGLQKDAVVLDGCTYVMAERVGPGEVFHRSKHFSIVYGMRMGANPIPALEIIRRELEDSGIYGQITDNPDQAILRKFVFVSPLAGAGSYYGVTAGELRANPEYRQLYRCMAEEVVQVAAAAGMPLEADIVEKSMESLDQSIPDGTASMYRDLQQGNRSELQSIIFDVLEYGRSLGLPMYAYDKVARKFGYTE